MKNVWILILVFALASSCSKENDPKIDGIVGEWKLIEAGINSFTAGPSIFDYSDENIIYDFQTNGKLVVTGGQNAGYPNGEYDFVFGEDYLSNEPIGDEHKMLLVKINGSTWTYNLRNGKMRLGQSYMDGPDLVLERK